MTCFCVMNRDTFAHIFRGSLSGHDVTGVHSIIVALSLSSQSMPMFRVSAGKAALSSFRLEKLRAALKDAVPNVALADTRHWYFVALKSTTLASTMLRCWIACLDWMTQQANRMVRTNWHACWWYLVWARFRRGHPRPPTSRSIALCRKWSASSAAWCITSKLKNGKALNEAERKAVLPLLHDRMTESVLDAPSSTLGASFDGIAEKIFQHGTPQPLNTVDILKGGKAALETANRELGSGAFG